MGKIDFLKWKALIQEGARALNLSVSSQQADLFAVHVSQLLVWNRKTNLTAITEPLEIAVKHFLDSLAAVPLIPEGAKFLDIGSGAGFPGIPIKTMLPSNPAILIDASRKKTTFLQHLIRLMKFPDICALHMRSEDMAKISEYQKHFDVIFCRALTDLETFVQTAWPMLAEKGFLLAYKAGMPETEMDRIQNLEYGFSGHNASKEHISTFRYRLPFLNHTRTLVIIHKIS